MLKKFKNFLLNKLFTKPLKRLSKLKRFYYKTIKVFWISIDHFFKQYGVVDSDDTTTVRNSNSGSPWAS